MDIQSMIKKILPILFFVIIILPLHAEQKIEKFLLITGSSRSGTTYIANVLTEAGLEIGHEHLKADGCSSWLMNVKTNHAPYGYIRTDLVHYQHIFHQVRDPLKTISSIFSTEKEKAFIFFKEYIPEIDREKDSRLVQSAKYWYYWNLKAEAQAEWRYKIEELDDVWDEMNERLGLSLSRAPLKTTRKTINHRRTPLQKITWADLKGELSPDLFLAIQEMSVRYGYPINNEEYEHF